MTEVIRDPDLTVHLGDARDVLAELADGSVDCIVTSPPYWGLRDYGTGEWEGGDPDCDHAPRDGAQGATGMRAGRAFTARRPLGSECHRCGARRLDRQLGLEDTPGEYVDAMVALFREARRVLAGHGTLWLNLGDSYASDVPYYAPDNINPRAAAAREKATRPGIPPGLKSKDLVGVPWRVALALQADGWWLRNDNIWSKSSPMPESVSDRATVEHEYVFLLSRSERYFYDREAVKERARSAGAEEVYRNLRTVWEIPAEPYGGAHFAVFPRDVARRCLLAGCPPEVCSACGAPRERIVERLEPKLAANTWSQNGAGHYDIGEGEYVSPGGSSTLKHVVPTRTVGWTDCGHGSYRPGIVLDPFMGSGTVAVVAREEGRRAVGIELSAGHVDLIRERTSQLSLTGA